jgi:hypothetical protein
LIRIHYLHLDFSPSLNVPSKFLSLRCLNPVRNLAVIQVLQPANKPDHFFRFLRLLHLEVFLSLLLFRPRRSFHEARITNPRAVLQGKVNSTARVNLFSAFTAPFGVRLVHDLLMILNLVERGGKNGNHLAILNATG